jgi:hypothetical protein
MVTVYKVVSSAVSVYALTLGSTEMVGAVFAARADAGTSIAVISEQTLLRIPALAWSGFIAGPPYNDPMRRMTIMT